MKTYKVFEREDASGDPYMRSEKLVFVGVGFSWLAFIAPAVWALLNQAWLALAGFVAVGAGLEYGLAKLNFDPLAVIALGLMVNIIVALEADTILAWTLGRKGFAEIGLVTGTNRDACELQFLKSWGRMLSHDGGDAAEISDGRRA